MSQKRENCSITVSLPFGVKDKLLKIASASGIPIMELIKAELTQFVLKNWNCKKEKPRFKPND